MKAELTITTSSAECVDLMRVVYYIVLVLLGSTECACTLINLLNLLNAGLIVSEPRERRIEEQTSPSLRRAIPAD